MEQLILHLIGDYVLQTEHMAKNKWSNSWWCLAHVIVYTLPFLLITTNVWTLFGIGASHFVIDRFKLARYLIFVKNWLTDNSLRWNDCRQTGFRDSSPAYLAVWLLIIVDNTLHLICNYLLLKYV